jgi:hypothetical protein
MANVNWFYKTRPSFLGIQFANIVDVKSNGESRRSFASYAALWSTRGRLNPPSRGEKKENSFLLLYLG